MPSYTLGDIRSAHPSFLSCFRHLLHTSPILPSSPILHSHSPSRSPSLHILLYGFLLTSNLPLPKVSTNSLLFPKTFRSFTFFNCAYMLFPSHGKVEVPLAHSHLGPHGATGSWQYWHSASSRIVKKKS